MTNRISGSREKILLLYVDTDQALRKHIDSEDKKTRSRQKDEGLPAGTFHK